MARLDEICSLNMGQSPDSSSYNEIGDGLPFFQGNADFGELHPKVRIWCNAPTKIAHAGDILISVRAPIGALNIADRDCCIGRGLAALTVDGVLCNRGYLWYAIANKVDELNSKGTGSTFKAISKNVLGETEISLPSLDKQLQIATILDKISDLISLRKQQIAKLDELVKARFVEMFGDPIENDKHLPIKKLGDICLLKAGSTTPADIIHEFSETFQIPCYGGNGIRGYVKECTQHGTYPIIGRQGALCGNVQLAKGNFHATEHAVLVTPLQEMNVFWLYYLLKYLDLYRYHTGAAQPGLAVKTLNTIEVPISGIMLQNKFATWIGKVDQQKLTIQQSLDKLEVLKKLLMQEYFGG